MGMQDYQGPVEIHRLREGVHLIRPAEAPAPEPEPEDAMLVGPPWTGNEEPPADDCPGHYDDDAALTSGVGIGEAIYCDGSCQRGDTDGD